MGDPWERYPRRARGAVGRTVRACSTSAAAAVRRSAAWPSGSTSSASTSPRSSCAAPAQTVPQARLRSRATHGAGLRRRDPTTRLRRFYSIAHIPREEHAALFGEVARWLRPGGLLLACSERTGAGRLDRRVARRRDVLLRLRRATRTAARTRSGLRAARRRGGLDAGARNRSGLALGARRGNRLRRADPTRLYYAPRVPALHADLGGHGGLPRQRAPLFAAAARADGDGDGGRGLPLRGADRRRRGHLQPAAVADRRLPRDGLGLDARRGRSRRRGR